MQECGTYRGFKLKGYYMGKGGTPDRIEQFNWCVPLNPTMRFIC
jgi:hypothetical protein